MEHAKRFPPLKSLHPDSSLNAGKLTKLEKLSTEQPPSAVHQICASLLTGEHCLKTRPDGTILEGHHRIQVLRQRGVDVDSLPRNIIAKEQE